MLTQPAARGRCSHTVSPVFVNFTLMVILRSRGSKRAPAISIRARVAASASALVGPSNVVFLATRVLLCSARLCAASAIAVAPISSGNSPFTAW